MVDIVHFPGITRLDMPAGRILDSAKEQDLKSAVVVGFTEDGEFYFASSLADGADVVWLLEMAKLKLLNIAMD